MLTLRAWKEAEEAELVQRLFADPLVAQYLPWQIGSLAEAEAWVAAKRGGETLAIALDDRAIGFVGVVQPHKDAEIEVGYVLERAAWGRGYASAALALRLAALPRPIVAYTDPANVASQRVLLRNGFERVATTVHRGQPRIRFRLA
jgi:RimJ/RimL family protein N-acetyltransferase